MQVSKPNRIEQLSFLAVRRLSALFDLTEMETIKPRKPTAALSNIMGIFNVLGIRIGLAELKLFAREVNILGGIGADRASSSLEGRI